MPKQKIDIPAGLPVPRGAYSMALRAGDFIYIAGQSARDQDLNVIGTTIEEQTARTIQNVAGMLEAAGASLADVVKSTVHLADLGMFRAYDAAYRQQVPEPFPVRTTVGSVLAPGILIEIDVVAYVGH
jgi:2-iminobutanoate/2-iminopropanoate deaminase